MNRLISLYPFNIANNKTMQTFQEKYPNIKYADLVLSKVTDNSLENPQYLENLMWSAYLAYIISDYELSKSFLEELNKYDFDGNFDKWTWIEGALVLLARIAKKEGDMTKNHAVIRKILGRLNYGDNDFKKKLAKKIVIRKLNGELLNLQKIEEYIINKDKEGEFLYSLSQLVQLVYIEEVMDQDGFKSDVFTHKEIEDKIELLKNQIFEIIK